MWYSLGLEISRSSNATACKAISACRQRLWLVLNSALMRGRCLKKPDNDLQSSRFLRTIIRCNFFPWGSTPSLECFESRVVRATVERWSRWILEQGKLASRHFHARLRRFVFDKALYCLNFNIFPTIVTCGSMETMDASLGDAPAQRSIFNWPRSGSSPSRGEKYFNLGAWLDVHPDLLDPNGPSRAEQQQQGKGGALLLVEVLFCLQEGETSLFAFAMHERGKCRCKG